MAEFDEFWAKHIETYDAIPVYLRDTVEQDISFEKHFPYIVFCPSDRYGWRVANEKMLCLMGKTILYYEKAKNNLEMKKCCFEEVIGIEEGHVLLYSWIKITGLFSGIPDTIFIEFNTVMERLFIKVLDTLRKEINHIDTESCGAELDKFNYLYNIDFKFGNHGKSSILGNEKVLWIVYQKKMKMKRNLFIYRNVIPESYIIVLTDKELIVVSDRDARKYWQPKTGSVWTYYPLCQVKGIQLTEGDHEETMKMVTCIGNEQIQRTFQTSNMNSFVELQATFEKGKASALGERNKVV